MAGNVFRLEGMCCSRIRLRLDSCPEALNKLETVREAVKVFYKVASF